MFVFIAALSDKFNFACRSASMLVCLVVDSGYIHTALYLLCLLLLGFCIDSCNVSYMFNLSIRNITVISCHRIAVRDPNREG